MRLFSLLPMILAAIFFAGSVSAHHKCGKNKSLGGKVYSVCKGWRTDQDGPMPTNMMQICRNILCWKSEMVCIGQGTDSTLSGTDMTARCVNDTARAGAKEALNGYPGGPFW
tara:strand:+ start:160 stop:495 length:336 start_codon:yes stop_codon:yes gene_type:complete